MKSLRILCHALLAGALLAQPSYAQQDVLRPTDNLHVEGVPPIPLEIVETVGRYTESRPASVASWHPSRREILILTRFANTNQVHRVAAPGGARTQLTFFPDRISGASYPRRDRGFFVFSKDVGGGEWFQNYRFDEGTGEVTLLTDGRSRNSLGVWSKAGDRMAYTSTRRTGRDTDIYVIDPADPATDTVVLQVEGGGWSVQDWSPDGQTLLISELISINESVLYLLPLDTRTARRISRENGEPVAYRNARFGPDGTIYATSDRDSEFQRLVVLDPETGRERALVGDLSWDIHAFDIAPEGRTMAFVTNEDGVSVLSFLDIATGDRRQVEGLPAGVIGGLRFRPDSSEVAFHLSAARTPGDAFSVRVRDGQVERWTFAETGGLNPETFAEPELISWPSFDGRRISGFLYRPPSTFTGPASPGLRGARRRPVIVNIHGGPESQARAGFLARNNYWLNELGIAIIFPNVRGSTGYGKTFVRLDNGLLREDSYRDIDALFDWIAEQPDLDPSRVMVTGGSYGGFMTFAIAANYADRIRCAVSVVGISNLRTFLENTEAYRRDLRRVEYGDERDPEIRAFMERIAPVNNAHRMTKPLFVIHGRNDPRVPWTESQQIVETLQDRGTPVWYLLAEDEGHGFAKKANADFQFYATVMFVREFLLGDGGLPDVSAALSREE